MGTHRQYFVHRLGSISDDMRRALQDFIACKSPATIMSELGGWKPPTDVFETEDGLVVRMDIAGVEPKDIFVGFDGRRGLLTIAGRRDDRHGKRKIGFHQLEITYGAFHRQVPLPVPILADTAKATYVNGFLEVSFKKARRPIRKVVSIRITI